MGIRAFVAAAGAAICLAGCGDLPTYDGGRASEAEQVGEMQTRPRASDGTYLGETMNARTRARRSLGEADAIRSEQVREEREFDRGRR